MASKPPRISSYLSFYLWQQRRRQQRRRQQRRQAEASAEASAEAPAEAAAEAASAIYRNTSVSRIGTLDAYGIPVCDRNRKCMCGFTQAFTNKISKLELRQ